MKKTVYPSLEEASRYRADYPSIPVSRTILSDNRTPIEVLRALKAVLDSAIRVIRNDAAGIEDIAALAPDRIILSSASRPVPKAVRSWPFSTQTTPFLAYSSTRNPY